MEDADDMITHIFESASGMSDTDYVEYLDEIMEALKDAANAKREELGL